LGKSNEKKICFIALASLPILTSDDNSKYIGGSELKSVLIGKELARRGFDTTFITYKEGIGKDKISGISIIETFPPQANYSMVKREMFIWKSIKKANADFYFQASGLSGSIPFFCVLHRRKYVKWIASNSDLMLNRIYDKYSYVKKITAYLGIKLASTVIVQNKLQQEMVENKFNKKSVLIKNPTIIPQDDGKNPKKQKMVLWVGTIRHVKQPDIFLKLAKEFPQYTFTMIGGEYIHKNLKEKEKEIFEKIKKESAAIPNLEFLGFIPHHTIKKYYEEASIFVNTSRMEGFPNTFLEAWVNQTPVVSLNIDPDNVISTEKLGFHSKTFEQMILDVRTLLQNDALRDEMGKNAMRYVEQHHDVKKIADEFEELIESFDK
jgi:glycosyltransferase involved in cell wall biosynthesis